MSFFGRGTHLLYFFVGLFLELKFFNFRYFLIRRGSTVVIFCCCCFAFGTEILYFLLFPSLAGLTVVGTLPIYYNGLFSPLLVQRFRCQKSRSLSVLYEQYETSYLFYVTLSFLCNIICYLTSVFAFLLVTLSGATTYWRRGTRTKKGTLQQAKGVNRMTYRRRYIATTKRYPTTNC